jgi:hypothetical protein
VCQSVYMYIITVWMLNVVNNLNNLNCV